jgi:hypothetical protein
MAHSREEDEDPALTEELRTVMRPRSGSLLLILGLIAGILAALAWVASRTELVRMWR